MSDRIYPAEFHSEDDGNISVEFTDIPGCVTCGTNRLYIKNFTKCSPQKLRAAKNYSVLERISIVPVEPAGVE